MPQDVAELMERFLSEDPTQWARLASNTQWRRLQLLLLREILMELRKLNQRAETGVDELDPSQASDQDEE